MSFPAIRDKVRASEPLSLEDGVALYEHPNLLEVGALANEVRERLHGDRTFFNRNLHINATNVCVASCMFCSFARLKEGDPGAYTMSHEEAWSKLRARVADLEARERAEHAARLADVGGVDVHVAVEEGAVAVHPLAHLVGQRADLHQVRVLVQGDAVGQRKRLGGTHLVADRRESRGRSRALPGGVRRGRVRGPSQGP